MADDIIDNLLRELRRLAPELSTDAEWKLEQRLRQACGGALVYVRKQPTPSGKVARLAVGLAAGRPLAEVFAAAEASRRTGYRLLARRWSRR